MTNLTVVFVQLIAEASYTAIAFVILRATGVVTISLNPPSASYDISHVSQQTLLTSVLVCAVSIGFLYILARDSLSKVREKSLVQIIIEEAERPVPPDGPYHSVG